MISTSSTALPCRRKPVQASRPISHRPLDPVPAAWSLGAAVDTILGNGRGSFLSSWKVFTKHPINFSQARPGRVRINDATPCVLTSEAPCPGFSQRHGLRRGDRDVFLGRLSGQERLETRQATEVGRLAESSSAGLDQANHSTWGAEQARGRHIGYFPESGTSNRATRPGSRAGSSSHSATRGHDDREGSDESALFAALEQLERQMSAGMIRARDSVVALEYTAREGPPGSRRLATGVVINSRGDVLSVRIDPSVILHLLRLRPRLNRQPVRRLRQRSLHMTRRESAIWLTGWPPI